VCNTTARPGPGPASTYCSRLRKSFVTSFEKAFPAIENAAGRPPDRTNEHYWYDSISIVVRFAAILAAALGSMPELDRMTPILPLYFRFAMAPAAGNARRAAVCRNAEHDALPKLL
jgi:hypothetical protein